MKTHKKWSRLRNERQLWWKFIQRVGSYKILISWITVRFESLAIIKRKWKQNGILALRGQLESLTVLTEQKFLNVSWLSTGNSFQWNSHWEEETFSTEYFWSKSSSTSGKELLISSCSSLMENNFYFFIFVHVCLCACERETGKHRVSSVTVSCCVTCVGWTMKSRRHQCPCPVHTLFRNSVSTGHCSHMRAQ